MDLKRTKRRRRKPRNPERVSSSLDRPGFSSNKSEPPPLSKTRPASWNVRSKTSVLHLNETSFGLGFEPMPDTKKFQPTSKLTKVMSEELDWCFSNPTLHVLQASPRTGPKTRMLVDFNQAQTLQEPHEKYRPHESSPESHAAYVNPVVLLTKIHPRLKFSCVCDGPPGGAVKRFVVRLELEGRVFAGHGLSKRVAKAQAAVSALHALHGVCLKTGVRSSLTLHLGTSGLRTDKRQQLPQWFADSIFGLVMQKSTVFNVASSPALLDHKGLAGIVLTTGLDLSTAQVVAMATGTKYISKNRNKVNGRTLRDCHAEVLCRRALMCFFYDQVELLLRSPSDSSVQSIFVPGPGGSSVFRLRHDVHLHMFISCPPCGDARLRQPHARTGTTTVAGVLSRRWRCGVRVKVDGEGTVPVSTHTHTDRDSLSCTDKMTKWFNSHRGDKERGEEERGEEERGDKERGEEERGDKERGEEERGEEERGDKERGEKEKERGDRGGEERGERRRQERGDKERGEEGGEEERGTRRGDKERGKEEETRREETRREETREETRRGGEERGGEKRQGERRGGDKERGDKERGDEERGEEERGDEERGDKERGEKERGDKERGDEERGEEDRGDKETGEEERGEEDRGDKERGEEERGERERRRRRERGEGTEETRREETRRKERRRKERGEEDRGDKERGDKERGEEERGEEDRGERREETRREETRR
ncbi:hypothetical protein WMY93_000013 [Mugilogobius chulae]|uniref:Adenosine deaminase RNA specific B2 (inactive) n=1 Tax=Mugilogobius chulae TaxID=88201 RepID=A0AAW0Q7Z5_9GOBI